MTLTSILEAGGPPPSQQGAKKNVSSPQEFLELVTGKKFRWDDPGKPKRPTDQSWALSVFLNFSIIKNDFIAFFIKLVTYFCTSPI